MLRYFLILGDISALALVTVYGFARHNELGSAGWRMMTTFLPLVIAWFLVSLPLVAFNPAYLSDPRQLWRPFWAMVLASPFASWLRAAWLNTAIQPQFVLIIGGVSALVILAWRIIYWVVIYRLRKRDG